MAMLLQIDCPFEGPFGDAMAEQLARLAASIAEEPDLNWKIWTENAKDSKAAGIELYADETSALAYLNMQEEHPKGFETADVRSQVFAVNNPLSRSTHASLPA